MSTHVEKYGGSSLASINQIKAVARRVIQSKSEGHQMVVIDLIRIKIHTG